MNRDLDHCKKCGIKYDSDISRTSYNYEYDLNYWFCDECTEKKEKFLETVRVKAINEFIQPERLNPEDSSNRVCDSLNSAVTQRGESEEVFPPEQSGHESNRMQAITQDTAIRNLLSTRLSNLGV